MRKKKKYGKHSVMTDICLNFTTRAAFDFGFKNAIIGDPTAKRYRRLNMQMVKAADIQRSFLAGISAVGNLYTAIMNTADFLKENNLVIIAVNTLQFT